MVEMRAALSGVPVQNAMITNFQTLRPGDPLSAAVDYFVAGYHHDFPVVDGGRLVGILSRSDLTQALERHGPHAPVGSFMQTQFSVADPREMLSAVVPRLRSRGSAIPVMDEGRLVGLLDAENLGQVLMLSAARQGTSPKTAAPPAMWPASPFSAHGRPQP
jgi:stage IV sporulation protein FB